MAISYIAKCSASNVNLGKGGDQSGVQKLTVLVVDDHDNWRKLIVEIVVAATSDLYRTG